MLREAAEFTGHATWKDSTHAAARRIPPFLPSHATHAKYRTVEYILNSHLGTSVSLSGRGAAEHAVVALQSASNTSSTAAPAALDQQNT